MGSLPILTWSVEGARHGLAYASGWAATELVGEHSKYIVETGTEEVPAMSDVWQDARQTVQQPHRQAVQKPKLNKSRVAQPMRWAKELL